MIWSAGDEGLQPFLERATWQQYPTATTVTPKTDVGTDSDNSPVCGATRMWLPEADYIMNVDVEYHVALPGGRFPAGLYIGW